MIISKKDFINLNNIKKVFSSAFAANMKKGWLVLIKKVYVMYVDMLISMC